MIATIGFFDGVHIGHRLVLERLVSLARERGDGSLVVTFWPHPRAVLQDGARELRLLTTLDEKKALLQAIGVDRVEVLDFNRRFAALTAAAFLRDILRTRFGVTTLLMGYDNRLGSDRLTASDLLPVAKELGMELIQLEALAPRESAAVAPDCPASETTGAPDPVAALETTVDSESVAAPETTGAPGPVATPETTGTSGPTAVSETTGAPGPVATPETTVACCSAVTFASAITPDSVAIPDCPASLAEVPAHIPFVPSMKIRTSSTEVPAQVPFISSTKIRRLLENGKVEEAASMLGYRYELQGAVVAGNRLGRTIGFPTANMKLYEPLKLVPGRGVYAVEVQVLGHTFRGMTNIGMRPTVGGTFRTIETHILDFDEDIYGLPLTIRFLRRIRDEIHFPSLEALKAQLALDRDACR